MLQWSPKSLRRMYLSLGTSTLMSTHNKTHCMNSCTHQLSVTSNLVLQFYSPSNSGIYFFSRNDCGLYTMLYIQSWDGKKISISFDSVYFLSNLLLYCQFCLLMLHILASYVAHAYIPCFSILQTMTADFRKFVAGRLLLSPMNEINISDFVKNHCIEVIGV